MFPWIMWSAILLAPFVVGGTLAFRTAHRAGKADRAMRALAARPGWKRIERRRDEEDRWAGHFPWLLRTVPGFAVTGTLGGRRVTVARRWEPVGRRDMQHWLIVCFEVRGSEPMLRLERDWSAAELGLRFGGDVPYLPMSTNNSAATAERFYASDLPDRLTRFAAPAVSRTDHGVCFLYFPLPEVVDMNRLLKALAGMLPGLAELAASAAPADDATPDAAGETGAGTP
ncbi:hypothetical protein ACFY30_15850 [Streptomyces sp. NPDC000345]|uniref:hypothetical protein n=1 Tax=Streptomyces sp. NPDC000345 TaxID=3364537 RepID=UPI0036CE48CE